MNTNTDRKLFTANGIGWMALLLNPAAGEWFILKNCRALRKSGEAEIAKWLIIVLSVVLLSNEFFVPEPWWIFCLATIDIAWFIFAWFPHRKLLHTRGAGWRHRSFLCWDTLLVAVISIAVFFAEGWAESFFAPPVLDTSDPEAIMESLEAIGEDLTKRSDDEKIDFLAAIGIIEENKQEIKAFNAYDGMSAAEIAKSIRRKYPERFRQMRDELRKAMAYGKALQKTRRSR